jgi:hypothetical protein
MVAVSRVDSVQAAADSRGDNGVIADARINARRSRAIPGTGCLRGQNPCEKDV